MPPDESHRPRRIWLSLTALFALLLGLLVYLYAFYDIPPPDPALYQVQFKPVPPGENALEAFARETKAMADACRQDWIDRTLDNDALRLMQPGCDPELKAYIDQHRPFLDRFWKLVNEAPRPLLFEGVNEDIDFRQNHISSEVCLQGARLAHIDVRWRVLTGDKSSAIEDALKLCAFAKELQTDDCLLLHWVSFLSIHIDVTESMGYYLSVADMTPSAVGLVLKRVQQNEPDPKHLARALRIVLLGAVNTWKQMSGQLPNVLPPDWKADWAWWEEFQFKPNMTIQEATFLIQPIIDDLENHDWPAALRASEKLFKTIESLAGRISWRQELHPNAKGQDLIRLMLNHSICVTVLVRNIRHYRCLQTALALRLYELEKGELPSAVEALVPHHLPALPQDPVTGAPLKWNRQTGRIYSVGESGKDDGGGFGSESQNLVEKDWGIVYPWRPSN
jgi:hypothetical protein